MLGFLACATLAFFSCQRQQKAENHLVAESRAINIGHAHEPEFSTDYVFTTAEYDPILGDTRMRIPRLQGMLLPDGNYEIIYTINLLPGTTTPDFRHGKSHKTYVRFDDGEGKIRLHHLHASDLQENQYDIIVYFKIVFPSEYCEPEIVFAKQTYSLYIRKKPEFTPIKNCHDAAFSAHSWPEFPSLGEEVTIKFTPHGDRDRLFRKIARRNPYKLHAILVEDDCHCGVSPNSYHIPSDIVYIDDEGNFFNTDNNPWSCSMSEDFISTLGMDPNRKFKYYAYFQQMWDDECEEDTFEILSVCTAGVVIDPVTWGWGWGEKNNQQ